MLKKVTVTIFLLSLLTVAIVQALEKAEPKKPVIGAEGPDFELENMSGEKVKLSDYRGKKVILNFWATWCPPCKEEMPAMESYHKQAGEDVVILAVNVDPKDDLQPFITENGITFTVLLDEKDEVNQMYQVTGIPTTFFIDEEGIIRNKHLSSMTEEMMQSYVDEM